MWHGIRRTALALACCAALPATAQAAPNWNRVADPAPGETIEYYDGYPTIDFAVAGKTPYLATEDHHSGELTVWRPDPSGATWVQVDGALNHIPLRMQDNFVAVDWSSMDAAGGTPWIAWSEPEPDGSTQLHVAKLVGKHFVEPAPAGWQHSNRALQPELVMFGGTPYVTTNGDITRLTASGDAAEPVTNGLTEGCFPKLTVSGERLYALCGHELLRLNADGSAWDHVLTHSETFQIADLSGTLVLVEWSEDGPTYALSSGDQLERIGFDRAPFGHYASSGGTLFAVNDVGSPGPDQQEPLTVAALVAGSWSPAPSPAVPEEGSVVEELIEGDDGNLWLLWHANDINNSVAPPRHVHIARYAEQGEPFDFSPLPSDPPAPGDGTGAPQTPPASGGDGGYTTPGGGVPPVSEPPPTLARGACANLVRGTSAGDRLVGSRLGDRILGGAGDDHLFGGRGSDCLDGGAGRDFVSGGAGSDALSGGRGADRIVAGGGRDSVAAGAGNDSVYAVAGGTDRVNCGSGRDTAHVSRNDLVKGCERVIVGR
jgi:Ca2+-binding RTX toxin-like protein